jgi:decaprenylphospho-beta-D-ribofuranose 2-oxidase
MNRGAPRQVAALVDQASPQPPTFPEPVVRRVGPEDQEQLERRADQGVDGGGNRDWPDVAIEGDHGDRPDDARQDPGHDFEDQRTLDVEEGIKPAARVLLNHGGRNASASAIAIDRDPSEITGRQFVPQVHAFAPGVVWYRKPRPAPGRYGRRGQGNAMPGIFANERELSGWGNCPRERCRVVVPRSQGVLGAILERGPEASYIPRGLGRAYGDSALNGGVIVQTALNRFLSFDETTGILECEAGVSLGEILRHLLPRGWFVAAAPGTQFITIGGAIAADVHGKNHHVDGTFGEHVLELQLLTALGVEITCSRAQNSDVFWATIGGMGLTGVIVRARLRLRKVPSRYVAVTYRRACNLDHALELLAATDHAYRYSVAWIDCINGGRSLGRSVVMLGNDAEAADVRCALGVGPFDPVGKKRRRAVPITVPSFVLNSYAVRVFNTLYFAAHPDRETIVDCESYFYPLDRVSHWNRLYGKRGFIQYQALLPPATSRQGLIALLESIVRSRRSSFLAVLKSTGAASPGMLSYPFSGHTLALDIPNTGPDLRGFLRELDAILVDHGGRLYLAKDAMTTAEVFATMYPRLSEFRAVKSRIDPNHRIMSSQARRLRIVEDR